MQNNIPDGLIDAIVSAVCNTHDGSDLWKHAKQDPNAFRNAVRWAVLPEHARSLRVWQGESCRRPMLSVHTPDEQLAIVIDVLKAHWKGG